MIENQRVRIFRAVARHLNFSRAAEELFLTQPAVTQQIKALEEEFRVPLFDRRGGSVELTAGGRALLPFANQMKDLSEKAFIAVSGANGEHAGVLNLGASQTIGDYVLPAFIAGFRQLHPKIYVRVRSGNTDEMLQAFVEGQVDAALIEGPALRKGLHVEAFMEDRMVLAVPPNHEWAGQEIAIDVLKQHPLLMREFGAGSRRVVEKAMHRSGLKKSDLLISMELDSTEGLLSAVEAGLGVAFVSQWAVRNRLALGTLHLAHIRGVNLSRKFSIVCPAGPEPSGTVGAFRSFLLRQSPGISLPGAASPPGSRKIIP